MLVHRRNTQCFTCTRPKISSKPKVAETNGRGSWFGGMSQFLFRVCTPPPQITSSATKMFQKRLWVCLTGGMTPSLPTDLRRCEKKAQLWIAHTYNTLEVDGCCPGQSRSRPPFPVQASGASHRRLDGVARTRANQLQNQGFHIGAAATKNVDTGGKTFSQWGCNKDFAASSKTTLVFSMQHQN